MEYNKLILKGIRKLKLKRFYSKLPVYIISFPKSGRTWVRLFLGKYLQMAYNLPNMSIDELLEVQKFYTYNAKIPKIHFTHGKPDGNAFWLTPKELKITPKRYAYLRVVLLVRDPKDVIVSSYFERTLRRLHKEDNGRKKMFQGSLQDYVYARTGSLDTILKFYRLWAENKQVPADFMLLRYEDLKNDTYYNMERLLKFTRVTIIPKLIKQAIDFSSFDKMKAYEKSENVQSDRLSNPKFTNPEAFKVRKGKIGGYKDYLDSATINYIQQRIREELPYEFYYHK